MARRVSWTSPDPSKIRVDVAELISALKLQLRKSGTELRGHCPNPDHPARPGPGSWQIRPDNGLHVCHACGFRGGPLALVRAVRQCTTDEAWIWISQFKLSTIPDRVDIAQVQKINSKSDKLRYPTGTRPLWRNVSGDLQVAVEYLAGRGIQGADVRRYAIGAVPNGVSGYGGRLIIPVVVLGEMIDFVARLFVPKSSVIAKAISGRRDAGAKKELALWGYDDLDPSFHTVHVVEGVWGAVAMRRASIPNVVAACGSAWSPERTQLLRPWSRVVFVPDGDAAGSKLIERASAIRYQSELCVVDLGSGRQPDHVDPAELTGLVGSAKPVKLRRNVEVSIRPWTSKISSG